MTRNCSPLESTRKGFSHDGGELNPTADNRSVIALMDIDFGKASSSETSSLQSVASRTPRSSSSGQAWRRMVDLPQPEGPTIRPMFHSTPSIGMSTSHSCAGISAPAGRSNMPATCSSRAVRRTVLSTRTLIFTTTPCCSRSR